MDTPRILVIDDDPSLRMTLNCILTAKGYETMLAQNGAEGLALLEQCRCNVVLIDIGLPDMPGLEVLDRVKADFPDTETIILTGNTTLDCAIEATNRGAFSYQLKPYDVEQLLLHIKRAIEKQGAMEKTRLHTLELERVNRELKALYEVSLAVSRTLDLEELVAAVLQTLVETGIFPFEIHGGMYLVEEGRALLVSWNSISATVVTPCREISCGQCFCGRALEGGEVSVSRNTVEDGLQVTCHPDTSPHGHIVVPLKAVDAVVGLLTLYTLPGTEASADQMKLFCSLGSQIGIAINNARLFQQTRLSSLQDALTGLANRRSLQTQMGRSFEAAKRYNQRLSVLMLDIDHFKLFNDTRGHLEGDRMLVRVAAILAREMRNADYVFRYGGEEFLIMLPETAPRKAREAAERLRLLVQSEAGVTVSIGIAAYEQGMADMGTLVALADAALYRAKDKGRNRVEVSGLHPRRKKTEGATPGETEGT